MKKYIRNLTRDEQEGEAIRFCGTPRDVMKVLAHGSIEHSVLCGAVSIFVIGFIWLTNRINRYAMARYGWRPIGIASTLIMSVPWLVVVLGCFVDLYKYDQNLLVAAVFGVLVTLAVFAWIASNTSIWIAMVSFPILMLLGFIEAVIVLYVVFKLLGRTVRASSGRAPSPISCR